MREVYLLRHGQTEWNLEGRLQGHLNSSLTDLGKIQAKTCGQVLKNHLNDSPIKLIASPLGRCIETAQIVASALGVSVIEKDSRLKEICFGRWEGMNRHEIQESDGAAFRARKADRWNVPAPEGESYRDVAVRVMSWLSELPDERISKEVGRAGLFVSCFFFGLLLLSRFESGRDFQQHVEAFEFPC